MYKRQDLFADYLIRNGEFGLSFIRATNGEHTEIVEQAHKVVGVMWSVQ